MQTERSGTSVGQGVLQAIFAVFLGLMITAVVGVGVYTFYPNPAEKTEAQLSELYRQRDEVQGCSASTGCKPIDELTEQERAELESLDDQQRQLEQRAAEQRDAWAQRSSIILVLIATGLMVVSLALGEGLSVLSNGILIGGLFTMLYGVGWGIASGNSLMRFAVLLTALVISIVLGYLKFARGRPGQGRTDRAVAGAHPATAGGSATVEPVSAPPELTGALGALADRVADLERRMAAAAALLGGRIEPPLEHTPEQPSPAPGGSPPEGQGRGHGGEVLDDAT